MNEVQALREESPWALAVAEAHASSARRTGGTLYSAILPGPSFGVENAFRGNAGCPNDARTIRPSVLPGRRAATSMFNNRVPLLGG